MSIPQQEHNHTAEPSKRQANTELWYKYVACRIAGV